MQQLDGQDLRPLPLLERKRQLELLLAPLPPDHPIRYLDHLIGNGPEIHRHACGLGVEGTIAKRVRAPYRSGRQGDWLKVKCHARQEFVIGGYTTVRNRGFDLGSLLLGDHRNGALAYVGRVGTGWDIRTAGNVLDALRPLQLDRSPFGSIPAAAKRGAYWVRPQLVAEVRFQTWTADGLLRHAELSGTTRGLGPAAPGGCRGVKGGETMAGSCERSGRPKPP